MAYALSASIGFLLDYSICTIVVVEADLGTTVGCFATGTVADPGSYDLLADEVDSVSYDADDFVPHAKTEVGRAEIRWQCFPMSLLVASPRS